MSGITVSSTTDTPEAILAAQGDKQPAPAPEPSAAPTPAPAVDDESPSPSAAEDDDTDSTKADDAEGGDGDDDEDPQPKRKGGFQKRIDKLNRKLTEAGQDAEYWRAQAMRNAGTGQAPAPEPNRPADPTQKPKADDFEDHDEYLEALIDWKAEEKLKARDAQARDQQLRAAQAKEVETFQTRVAAAQAKYDDFDDVIDGVSHINLSLAVQEALRKADLGAEMMYELANDPAELERICRLPALEAALELGEVRMRVKAKQTSPAPATAQKVTKAPKPVEPIGSKSGGASTKSPDQMSYQEFKAWREKQLKT